METASPFRLPRKTPFGVGEKLTEWATGLHRLSRFYAERPAGQDTEAFLRYTLDVLGIDYQVVKGGCQHIPAQGATVVVANHPLGCAEGVILAQILRQIRPDVKILANHYLKNVPELDALFIGVDVFEGQGAVRANARALREANRHLSAGGLLLMFPAGEVSVYDRKSGQLRDKVWSKSVSRLIHKHKATTVPVFIGGRNSRQFYMAGKVHPMLRTLMLGREMLNKRATQIPIAIGESIRYSEVKNIQDDQQLVNYLKFNTYLLGNQTNRSVSGFISMKPTARVIPEAEPIDPPVAAALLEADIANLGEAERMLSSGEFDVYCARAAQIPSVLKELGRIREINFRAVGEGTGKSTDLDGFDQNYLHLFVWDRQARKIVGAYRLGLTDELIAANGLAGLYSRTLFRYDERFIGQYGASIELGRSVVAEEYQRSLSALLLLWKGISAFVCRHPKYTHLFGPVSISDEYSQEARQLMATCMTVHHSDQDSAKLVAPTYPLASDQRVFWQPDMLTALADVQLLSRVIARMDTGKSVPVLLRQYLGLNGKLVCFNVDPDFNDALDGLIVVDLTRVPEKTLAKYMDPEKASAYLAYHDGKA
ncbi:lysophospholipid acyltransferase family protein [Photobacterium galatheae]|uniref:L-ornithine N(alpha)-acyltransferase n=1 Tax=Photobacterium galatheae TaxID=1654360 RepID=A0A066RKB9_9GAMM|nr:GNAT family N-acyltransferase [Photobacterium galatheae]KDM90764.1 hemolysin [Photobacterium galatheae]MCM0149908.1 lysophospholipid acyltransferase family protein [Photobacterium galatheae]